MQNRDRINFLKQKANDRAIKGYGSIFRKLLRPVIRDQETRFLQRLPLITKPTKKNIMDLEYENRVVALALRPVYIAAMTEGIEKVLKPLGIFIKSVRPALLLDQKIFNYADKYSFAMAKYINNETIKKIKPEILSGLKEHLSYAEIGTKIQDNVFTDLAVGNRSTLIARTEAHGMVENGSYEGAVASGVVEEKTWSSAGDARPTHLAANGQTVLINDVFIVGGYQLRFPGDTSLGAGMEEIARCRCSVEYSSTIHEDRLTSSKELLAEQPPSFPKENFGISQSSAKELAREANINSLLFDQTNYRETASMTKKKIAGRLTEELKDNKAFTEYIKATLGTDVTPSPEEVENFVRYMIQSWAGTSGDEDMMAIAMQMAAKKEFGLTNVTFEHYSKEMLDIAETAFKEKGEGLRAFLRAQYNTTQAFFKENGITSITGFRGMKFASEWTLPENLVFEPRYLIIKDKLQLQPISSFTTDLNVAKTFSERGNYRMVIQSEVPVERIMGTCQTGYGCKNEAEFVVLGGEDTFKIATYGQGIPEGKLLDVFGGIK